MPDSLTSPLHQENDVQITSLFGEDSLFSAVISEIRIFKQGFKLYVELTITNDRKGATYNSVSLLFEDVKEYGFYHSADHIFYNIEEYKLFATENTVYASFDPADRLAIPSEGDQDFIISKSIKVQKQPIPDDLR